MKTHHIDNFKHWRTEHPVHYTNLSKDGDLAEYIGVVLGDGHIEKFPRTERITITGDIQKPEYIWRYATMTEKLFKKTPTLERAKDSRGFRLSLYQKFISARLGIPTGNRKDFKYKLPRWISNDQHYIPRFLRGLFEAEGSLCIHPPTCTYNFCFTNYNQHLLAIVKNLLIQLEFHPEVRHNAIRIRKCAGSRITKAIDPLSRILIAGSANGRHMDSESINLGSNPSPATTFEFDALL